MTLTPKLIAKFVVWRCAFCKRRWDFGFFCSVNHFSEVGVYVNHSVTCLSSLAENDSRLLKNSEGNRDGERIFHRRKEADVALFLQVTRIRKIRKIWEANLTSRLLPKQDDHKATNLETRNKQNGSKSTNHESQTMTFLTRASKHMFPEQKNPKFANRTARYNECRGNKLYNLVADFALSQRLRVACTVAVMRRSIYRYEIGLTVVVFYREAFLFEGRSTTTETGAKNASALGWNINMVAKWRKLKVSMSFTSPQTSFGNRSSQGRLRRGYFNSGSTSGSIARFDHRNV